MFKITSSLRSVGLCKILPMTCRCRDWLPETHSTPPSQATISKIDTKFPVDTERKTSSTGLQDVAVNDENTADERDAEAQRGQKKAKSAKPKQTLSASWNTSKYRGVTRHRRSGRYATLSAHVALIAGVTEMGPAMCTSNA